MIHEDIRGKESLQAWLQAQSRDVAVTVAFRAAMRVAPSFWAFASPTSATIGRTTAALARPLLISGAAGTSPTPEITNAAVNAGAANFVPSGELSATSAAFAACAAVAAETFTADAAKAVADASFAADAFAGVAYFAFWRQIARDAGLLDGQENGRPIQSHPLSLEDNYESRQRWPTVRKAWASAGPGWQFWIDWYDAALEGRPLLGDWDRHWDLLTEIALIPDVDWTAGDEHVNGLIAAIVERHRTIGRAIDSTPNAEQIVVDAASGKLTCVPVPEIGGDLLAYIERSVAKAIERFETSCSATGTSNFGPVLKDCAAWEITCLREDLAENAGYDLGLHDALDDCLGSLRRRFAEQGLENEPAAVRLLNVLERCAIDVLNNSPSAREVIEKRREELFLRLKLEPQTAFDQLCADMARDCLPLLQKRMLADIARANDETADPDLRRRSRYNLVSRLPRGARAVRYSRFEDGRRIVEDEPKPKDDKLWVATVLGPIGAALLGGLFGG